MIIAYGGESPAIHEDAYVAPNAVIRGDVTIEKGASVLFGAVITAEGGPVRIGKECVIMEQAVLRGTPKHPLELGHSVLVGPHSHLSGCRIDEDVFIATGCTIFNGVHVQRGAEIRINGIVHVNSLIEPETVVPIGWIAVGNPARLFSPDQHEELWEVQRKMNFPKTVWGVERSVSKGERTRKYAKALQRHKDDEILPNGDKDE